MKKKLAFLPAVHSRAELDGVVPDADVAYAYHAAPNKVFAFFVFANGAWGDDSVEVHMQTTSVVHGDEIEMVRADGSTTQAVFTAIDGHPMAFEVVQPHSVRNYTPRFYADERGGAKQEYSLIARVPKRVPKPLSLFEGILQDVRITPTTPERVSSLIERKERTTKREAQNAQSKPRQRKRRKHG